MHTYLRTYVPTYLPTYPTYLPTHLPTYLPTYIYLYIHIPTYIYLHTPTYITGRSSDPVGCDPIESTKLLDCFFFYVFLFVFFFKQYFLLFVLSVFCSYNVFFFVFVCLLCFFFHVFLLLLSVTVRYPVLIQWFSGNFFWHIFSPWIVSACRWKIFGSNMEMEPESVSETSWYPEIVPLMRDVKMRLSVKKEGCLRRHVSMGIEVARQPFGRWINLDFSWCTFWGVWSPKWFSK